MTPDQYCQQLLEQSGSSFSLSFIFLAPKQRQAITALYAFCRQVDDIADNCREVAVAETSLNWWSEEIERIYARQATHPIGLALSQALENFPLEKAWFHDIITGVRQDLSKTRFADRAELEQYCYYVAGAVGLLSTQIFGYRNPQTLEYAKALGQALQMTNIIRDVLEDGQRDRIYLPLEDLQRFGVTEAMLLKGEDCDATRALLNEQIEIAESLYARAYALLPPEEIKAQRAALIMAAIYARLLARIKRKPQQVLKKRVRISSPQKLWLAWRTARAAGRGKL